jgi:hypothetical protein
VSSVVRKLATQLDSKPQSLWEACSGSFAAVCVISYRVHANVLQEEWRRKKDEEKAARDAEVEARMQKWLAEYVPHYAHLHTTHIHLCIL